MMLCTCGQGEDCRTVVPDCSGAWIPTGSDFVPTRGSKITDLPQVCGPLQEEGEGEAVRLEDHGEAGRLEGDGEAGG